MLNGFETFSMMYESIRDEVIGELSGKVGRLCYEVEARKEDLASARREAEELRRSTSFRLGNAMLRPLTRLRGLQGAWRRHEGRA